MARAVSASRMPPEALTPRASPTVARMSATAWVEAPPAGWKPVEVLTKSAPAATEAVQAATISSSVSAADSMMTLRMRGDDAAHGRDLLLEVVEARVLHQLDVDDHVDLVRAVGDGLGGLEGLDLGLDRARGEANHAGDLQALGDLQGQHRGGHAHREGASRGALLDDAGHVCLGGLGLEDRVVDHRGHVTLIHGTTFLSHHSWARGRASSIMVVKDV